MGLEMALESILEKAIARVQQSPQKRLEEPLNDECFIEAASEDSTGFVAARQRGLAHGGPVAGPRRRKIISHTASMV
jgi:hypothetical protein